MASPLRIEHPGVYVAQHHQQMFIAPHRKTFKPALTICPLLP